MRVPTDALLDVVSGFVESEKLSHGKRCAETAKGQPIKVRFAVAQLDAALCLLLYTFVLQAHVCFEGDEALVAAWKGVCRLIKYH